MYTQGYGLSSCHVWMWELDSKEGRVLKNWCFLIVVLEKTLESPLESKEIKPVNLKENQPWILFGRIDAEAEAPILWPPDAKNWLIWKDPDAGKDWRREEKGTTQDEMVVWHHQFNGPEFEQVGVGQRSWWWTGKPGMLQSMGSWRVGHDLVTQEQWTSFTSSREPDTHWVDAQSTCTKYMTCKPCYVQWMSEASALLLTVLRAGGLDRRRGRNGQVFLLLVFQAGLMMAAFLYKVPLWLTCSILEVTGFENWNPEK